MRRFFSVLMLMGGLLATGGAYAVPVTWTIPATTLSGSGNSISGTFVYDADTNTTSSINLSSTISGTTTTLTYAGSNAGGYVRFQGAAAAVASSTPSAYLGSTGLTNAGGSVTISVNFLGNGLCAIVSGGICTIAGFTGTNSSPVTVIGVAPVSAPTATTDPATSITTTGATLNGTVSANGASTTVNFQYGLTSGYGSTVAASQSPLASGASSAAVTAAITGLTCNTTYHFRVNANNGTGGTINGNDETFTTSACATPPAPQPIPTLSEWAQIMMMLAMIATAGFYGWRMKQR